MHLNRYPDATYQDKATRIAKTWGYVLAIIVLAILVWIGLGAPVSHGGIKEKLKGKLSSIARCVKNSDGLIWNPSTNPEFISHYLVFASKRPNQLKSAKRLLKLTPFGTTKELEILIPSKYRKRLYFYTVQAVSYGGLRSRPAKPISCLQKGQGK